MHRHDPILLAGVTKRTSFPHTAGANFRNFGERKALNPLF
jgi:hypothetical protein